MAFSYFGLATSHWLTVLTPSRPPVQVLDARFYRAASAHGSISQAITISHVIAVGRDRWACTTALRYEPER